MPATGAWFIAVPAKLVNSPRRDSSRRRRRPIGMCVAGGVTIVTPKKLLPVAWQVAQPEVMPAWFIAVPAKLVNLLAAWQVSHACVVGMCVRRRRVGHDVGEAQARSRGRWRSRW